MVKVARTGPLQGYANIDSTCHGLSGQQPEDQHIVPPNNYQDSQQHHSGSDYYPDIDYCLKVNQFA